MKENLSKQQPNSNLATEENTLHWNEILKKFELTFGKDIYESWIKTNLKFFYDLPRLYQFFHK